MGRNFIVSFKMCPIAFFVGSRNLNAQKGSAFIRYNSSSKSIENLLSLHLSIRQKMIFLAFLLSCVHLKKKKNGSNSVTQGKIFLSRGGIFTVISNILFIGILLFTIYQIKR